MVSSFGGLVVCCISPGVQGMSLSGIYQKSLFCVLEGAGHGKMRKAHSWQGEGSQADGLTVLLKEQKVRETREL